MSASMKLYEHEMRILLSLSKEELGNIMTALLQSAIGEEHCELLPLENAVFMLVKSQVDRAAELANKRKQAGEQGGAPDGNNNAKTKQPKTSKNKQTPQKNKQIQANSETKQPKTSTNTSTNTSTSTNTIQNSTLYTSEQQRYNTNQPNNRAQARVCGRDNVDILSLSPTDFDSLCSGMTDANAVTPSNTDTFQEQKNGAQDADMPSIQAATNAHDAHQPNTPKQNQNEPHEQTQYSEPSHGKTSHGLYQELEPDDDYGYAQSSEYGDYSYSQADYDGYDEQYSDPYDEQYGEYDDGYSHSYANSGTEYGDWRNIGISKPKETQFPNPFQSDNMQKQLPSSEQTNSDQIPMYRDLSQNEPPQGVPADAEPVNGVSLTSLRGENGGSNHENGDMGSACLDIGTGANNTAYAAPPSIPKSSLESVTQIADDAERHQKLPHQELQRPHNIYPGKLNETLVGIEWVVGIDWAAPTVISQDAPNCPSTPTDKPIVTPIDKPKKQRRHKADDEFSDPITEERFHAFWSAYPRKNGYGDAVRAWNKLCPSQDLLDKILKSVADARASPQWQKDNGEFIPMASTWINQKRWNDVPYYGINGTDGDGKPMAPRKKTLAELDMEYNSSKYKKGD